MGDCLARRTNLDWAAQFHRLSPGLSSNEESYLSKRQTTEQHGCILSSALACGYEVDQTLHCDFLFYNEL